MADSHNPLQDLLALQHPARHFSLDCLGLRRLQSSSGNVPRLRGRGMTFEEHRAYAPGDEPRFIDWRVTARTGEMHTKIFREEHERPVLLFADQRAGMRFGTRRQFKSRLALESCALLGWTAAHSRERVGGIALRSSLRESPARSGIHGVLPWLNLSARAEAPNAAQTAEATLATALLHLRRTLRPGSIVAISSDFADLDADARNHLVEIARHNQLILLPVGDPLEFSPPEHGQFPLRLNAQTQWVDFSNSVFRDQWIAHYQQRREALEALAQQTRAVCIALDTTQSAAAQLAPWLTRR